MGNSRKTETKDAFGVTRGSYQYVDANGVLQTVNYVADPVNGFRVAGTNIPVAPGAPNAVLPVAPGVPVVEPLEAPVPVMETAEVAAARAEHLKAVEEAKAATTTVERKKREAEPTDADYKVPAAPILVHAAPAPVFINPVAQPATLVHTVTAPVSVAEPAPIPTFTAPAPIAPLPFSTASAPLPFAAAPAPIPFAAAPAPIPFAAAPAPFPLAAAPTTLSFAAAPVPTPINPVPAPIQFAAAPIPVAQAPGPAAPLPIPFAPAAAPLAVAPHSAPSSQFHAQDEFGQFSFGYENINSRKTETKDAFGVTRGSYQYVDANGILQTVNYVADPVNGFRVAGTNIPVAPGAPNAALPVAPGVPVVEPLEAPVPVMETPEVAAARAEHLKAVEEAKAASEEAEPTTEAEL